MSESFVTLRITYKDLPHMVEVAIDVRHGGWTALAKVYVSPDLLTAGAAPLATWSRDPRLPFEFGSGIDPRVGGFLMRFRITDGARHVRCLVQVATRDLNEEPIWQATIDVPTELGLVERFAVECTSLGRTLAGRATLVGPAGC